MCGVFFRIEEAKRAIKRPSEHDRYAEVERKRPAAERRFEPPPPPRFDTSITRFVEKSLTRPTHMHVLSVGLRCHNKSAFTLLANGKDFFPV